VPKEGSAADGRPAPEEKIPPRVNAAKATILLVEDEESVRRVVVKYLTASGFRIIAAENARSAEPLWREHLPQIDLLLTDVVLPDGMNGRQLAEVLLREKPDLRVIFTSGFNMELAGPNQRLRPGISFIAKPYRPDQLLEAVHSSLNTQP
jgi:DNA-binding NtrC family response regulator